jgi:hypothetical protein
LGPLTLETRSQNLCENGKASPTLPRRRRQGTPSAVRHHGFLRSRMLVPRFAALGTKGHLRANPPERNLKEQYWPVYLPVVKREGPLYFSWGDGFGLSTGGSGLGASVIVIGRSFLPLKQSSFSN